MNEFMIKFASAESALSQMQQLESAIRSEGEEIAKIRSGFNAQFGGRARILQNLRGQMDRMSDLGDSMKTFESSLESILGIYNAVEQNLLGQLEDQIISGTGSTETAPVAEDAGSADETVDRIHHAGKEDERRGLIPGATIIGGATLGSAAYKDQGTGMGQGAGNLQTELIVPYLNEHFGKHYNYEPILEICDILDTKMIPTNLWGYSVTRLLPAVYKTAYKYALVMRNKYHLSFRQMNQILRDMPDDMRNRYTKDNLAQLLETIK